MVLGSSEKGWYWDHFEPTVQMSVYLVCIAISDFTSQDAEVPLRGNRPVKVKPGFLIIFADCFDGFSLGRYGPQSTL